MTPAARYAAAIEILDTIVAATPAERALTTWARQNRFAGSKDRAAIRDHVFDVLRARRSLGALGGGDTGRALVLGLLRRYGLPPDTVFGAGGYGPDALTDAEQQAGAPPTDISTQVDIPAWLWPAWQDTLGNRAEAVATAQQTRAPIALRVNLGRGSRAAAREMLMQDDIGTEIADQVDAGLLVTRNPRRVNASVAYQSGLVELQDIASQMAVARLPLGPAARVLDYCAGGGGKGLAIADRFAADVVAYDIDPARMRDIPVRAQRAGVSIDVRTSGALSDNASFDLVFCDAPCSGSGTWRRTPDAKWALTPEKLQKYNQMQREVLVKSQGHVAQNGILAYATCSVLDSENDEIVAAFCADQPDWQITDKMQLLPTDTHDGFYLAILRQTL